MKIRHICFDLDGTLVNSFPTIYKCTLKTLKHLNISYPAIGEKAFENLIGHHFTDIFTTLEINVEDVESFIGIYKNFYFDFIEDSELYPDTIEVLYMLKKAGIKISLLTTKAQDQAERIVEHFGLLPYFDAVYGRRPGMGIKPEADPLLRICQELNVTPGETLMTGDSDLDMKCGKNAGAKTCAVTYGYRSKEILELEKPDFIVNFLREIAKIFELGS